MSIAVATIAENVVLIMVNLRLIYHANCSNYFCKEIVSLATNYVVSRGFCEGAAAVNANLRLRINIKLRM